MENRFTTKAKVELREDGKTPCFVGHAAVFYNSKDSDTEYWLWEDYVERLQPGCFDRALKDSHDARALFNHDSNMLLGRVSSKTCELSVDKTGLHFSVPYDENDPDHQRVKAKIDRGDLTGCSFAFSNVSADWEELSVDEKTVYVRNIKDLDLHDVGPVTFPAYEATDVGLRTSVLSKGELVEARSNLTKHRDSLNDHIAEGIEVDYQAMKAGLEIG